MITPQPTTAPVEVCQEALGVAREYYLLEQSGHTLHFLAKRIEAYAQRKVEEATTELRVSLRAANSLYGELADEAKRLSAHLTVVSRERLEQTMERIETAIRNLDAFEINENRDTGIMPYLKQALAATESSVAHLTVVSRERLEQTERVLTDLLCLTKAVFWVERDKIAPENLKLLGQYEATALKLLGASARAKEGTT